MSTATQHYIRTIHTSFTASSSAWASSSPHAPHHWASHPTGAHYYPAPLTEIPGSLYYKTTPQTINLGSLGHGLVLGDWRNASGSPYTYTRKRPVSRSYPTHAASRVAPPPSSVALSPAPRASASATSIKYQHTFDPFYDEPLIPASSELPPSPMTSATAAASLSPSPQYSVSSPASASSSRTATTSVSYASPRSRSNTLSRVHTISIPPVSPSSPPPASKSAKVALSTVQSTPSTLEVPPSTSASISSLSKSLSSAARGDINRGSVVAGILLNRVHAVGKPMRRRPDSLPKEYVKSGLSTVVACEA